MLFPEPERRERFPVTRDWIYLNHAAVGPLPSHVLDASRHYLGEASTKGEKHWERTQPLAESLRGALAGLLGVDPEEIAFTRNTSEGLSILAFGLDWREGDNVVIPDREFPSNVYPWLALGRRGVKTRLVPLTDGGFTVDDVLRHTDGRTRVVSVSSVQFHNGFVADLDGLGRACRERGILFCVDAIQQLGAFPLDARRSGVDFLACGAHKWLMSGEGTGFLYCRRDLAERLSPVLVGWAGVRNWEDFQIHPLAFREGALRFETGNFSAIGVHNLHASLSWMQAVGMDRIAAAVRAVAGEVLRRAVDRGFRILGPSAEAVSGIVSFAPPGADPETLAAKLAERGVQVSKRNGALRVSPHCYNTRDEVDALFDALDDILRGD
ncbi:MAG: aminotransferase class V-fold PLP-dependent enzyme [Acidobacteria bacterium]|nr:aminotransferase class V-fold PLP-dependent enzyme [Acidobacteriota bacterium]